MKLVPLEDRVVVKVIEQEEKTSSGIVLPDTAKEKPSKGSVVAVGPGKYDENGDSCIPMPVKRGDMVVFAKYAGTEIKLDGEEYLVLRASRHHRRPAQGIALFACDARTRRSVPHRKYEGDWIYGKTAFVR